MKTIVLFSIGALMAMALWYPGVRCFLIVKLSGGPRNPLSPCWDIYATPNAAVPQISNVAIAFATAAELLSIALRLMRIYLFWTIPETIHWSHQVVLFGLCGVIGILRACSGFVEVGLFEVLSNPSLIVSAEVAQIRSRALEATNLSEEMRDIFVTASPPQPASAEPQDGDHLAPPN
jgi:hypothetical protein